MRNVLCVFLMFFAAHIAKAVDLKGGDAAQDEQDRVALEEGLVYIENDAMLRKLVAEGVLVPIPRHPAIKVDWRVERKFLYVLPRTADYLRATAEDFWSQFKRPFYLNSVARTVVFQQRLSKHNPNAAPAVGPHRSVHMTGATVDIGKLKLTQEEQEWFRKRLLKHKEEGVVVAIEEHHQAVFHVMVAKPKTMKASQ